MMKTIDRRVLAFIQLEHSDEVLIDIVEVSKKGTSYFYRGTVWNRSLPTLGRDNCRDPQGNRCKIVPLHRTYSPSWAQEGVITIKEEAKERYDMWQMRKLKP